MPKLLIGLFSRNVCGRSIFLGVLKNNCFCLKFMCMRLTIVKNGSAQCLHKYNFLTFEYLSCAPFVFQKIFTYCSTETF